MIIAGNPQLGLQEHQQKAYDAVEKAHKINNKAAVVLPTGCGKSFVALQLMADNKDKRILFMAPTNVIRHQMYNYIAKYIVGEKPEKGRTAKMIAKEYFPNLKILLYPTLLRAKDEILEKLNADIIIMDELHRTGADKWGERVNTLIEKNPNAKILGLTATPDRMDNRNVVDSLFEGNISYELTLIEALRKGIVKSPIYVKCDYALGEELEGIRRAILECTDEQSKEDLQKIYEKMRRIVEQAEGIPELIAKNIRKKDGKYIIFCKDKENMDELIKKAKEWFGRIDEEPEIYSVYSGEGYTDRGNSRTIEKFENSKSKHIKLLFSIEMLNEGLHVEDISGVIMARPTNSRIIYLQQLGRALSSDPSRDKVVVFDLVNNYIKNNLDAEVNEKNNGTERNPKDDSKKENNKRDSKAKEIGDVDIFRIQGETQEFLQLLYEAKGIINRGNYLVNAQDIKRWIEESGDTRLPKVNSENEEERRLGLALKYIRQGVIKPYLELQTEEEKKKFREKHPEVEEVIKIISEIDENNAPPHLRNTRTIREWIERSGDTKTPSQKSKDAEERRLGKSLSSIRQNVIKPYLQLQTEEEKEKFKEKHPETEEVVAIINEIDKNNTPTHLRNARAIQEWIEKSGDTKPPATSSKNEEERRLGGILGAIRHYLLKPYIELENEEEKKKFREKHPELEEVMKIINEIDANNSPPYLRNARAIKEWVERTENARLPNMYSKNKEEKRLGDALRNIRRNQIKAYQGLRTDNEREEFIKKYPGIEEVLLIISDLDGRYGNPRRQELKKLIEQNLAKRAALKEAKRLEQEYKQQCNQKLSEVRNGDTEEQGADFDG